MIKWPNRCPIVMTRIGVLAKVVHMIKTIYGTPQFNVKDGTNTTDNRKPHTGIRQGYPLSPYFCITLPIFMINYLNDDFRRRDCGTT